MAFVPLGWLLPEGEARRHRTSSDSASQARLSIAGSMWFLCTWPGCISGRLWHISRMDSAQCYCALFHIRGDRLVPQCSAVLQCPISLQVSSHAQCLLILSRPVNCLHSAGPGSSPVPTHCGSPRDTLGPPDSTFRELVRNQGQRQGLRRT